MNRHITRREILKLGGAAVVAAAVGVPFLVEDEVAEASIPKVAKLWNSADRTIVTPQEVILPWDTARILTAGWWSGSPSQILQVDEEGIYIAEAELTWKTPPLDFSQYSWDLSLWHHDFAAQQDNLIATRNEMGVPALTPQPTQRVRTTIHMNPQDSVFVGARVWNLQKGNILDSVGSYTPTFTLLKHE